MSTATAGCSKKQLAFGFAGDQIQDSSRRQVSATTCNDYAVVPAASSGYCGQIIGNAFEIKGLSSLTAGSSLKVCLPIDNKIPTCPGKYTTYDISKAKSDRTPGPPLNAAVVVNGGELCANVQTDGGPSMMFFPILRTSDSKPHVGFTGQVVKAEMTLSYASKELFTVARQDAFKSALASTIGASGISASDIVILKICDANGCTVVYSNRRSTSSGVTVEYQVQVAANAGVTTTQISNTMSGSSFSQSFTTALNQELGPGSSITATLNQNSVKAETVTASQPAGATTTTPAPTSAPGISSASVSSGSVTATLLSLFVSLAALLRS